MWLSGQALINHGLSPGTGKTLTKVYARGHSTETADVTAPPGERFLLLERENMQRSLEKFRAQEGKQTGHGGKAEREAGEQERIVALTRDRT